MRILIRERSVEVDRKVRPVAEGLIAGMPTAAQCHLVRMGDFTPIDIRQAYRPADQIGTVRTRRDRYVSHR